MKTFKQFKKAALKKPGVKKAYEELDFEFELIRAIIEQRLKKGLTQKELANKAGTQQSAIARFESGNYNPSLLFIRRLSNALNLKIKVEV